MFRPQKKIDLSQCWIRRLNMPFILGFVYYFSFIAIVSFVSLFIY